MNLSKNKKQNSLAIIIPCYNCENTIIQCLDSVGVHNNIRVIAVNDCSKDSTLEKLQAYGRSNKDFNITIVNNEHNKGPGLSRNVGLKSVCEDYLMFLDADDALDPDYYSNLEYLLEKSEYDCMVFRAKRIINGHEREFKMFLSDAIAFGALGKEAVAFIKGCPWGKVYRTSIIKENQIYFADLYRSEDMVFTKIALATCARIGYFDSVLYRYFDTPGSIMNSSKKLDIRSSQKAFNQVNDRLRNAGFDSELNSIYFFEVLYDGTVTCVKDGIPIKDCNAYFRDKLRNYSKKDAYYKQYSWKYRIVYTMARYGLLWILKLL